MPTDEIFDDPFMNDMLLNLDLYGMEDEIKPGEVPEMTSGKLRDIINDKEK